MAEDHGSLVSFEELMMYTLIYLMNWLILMVTGRFFIMMSWIAWIHGLVGACDSDEVVV